MGTRVWGVPGRPISPLSTRGSLFHLFFSPHPRCFSSPPIAALLCGLISLSKWHNPPGNLWRRGEPLTMLLN